MLHFNLLISANNSQVQSVQSDLMPTRASPCDFLVTYHFSILFTCGFNARHLALKGLRVSKKDV